MGREIRVAVAPGACVARGEGLGRVAGEGLVQRGSDEESLPCKQVRTAEVLVGFALQHSLQPLWCLSAEGRVGVAPGHEVRACSRHRRGVDGGGSLVEEGAELVDWHSGLGGVALARYPQGVGFIVRSWVGVLVDRYPGSDSAAGLVTPDLGLAQGREGGDRDLLVDVARVPPEGGGSPGASIQFQLQGGEGFAAGHAEALRRVLREAVSGPEQSALAVDQEDSRVVAWDQAERVHQAPQFSQEGVGRPVYPARDASPGRSTGNAGCEGAVEAGAVGDDPPDEREAQPLVVQEPGWRHAEGGGVLSEGRVVAGAR